MSSPCFPRSLRNSVRQCQESITQYHNDKEGPHLQLLSYIYMIFSAQPVGKLKV